MCKCYSYKKFLSLLKICLVLAVAGFLCRQKMLLCKHDKYLKVKTVGQKAVHNITNQKVNEKHQLDNSSKDLIIPMDRGLFRLPAPKFKFGKIEQNAEILLGVPSIKRYNGFYLMKTIKSFFENHGADFSFGIIILIGESDSSYADEISKRMETEYGSEIQKGRLQIVVPPVSYYPDWNSTLQSNFGDTLDRVKWRSKQNLDAIYLMLYTYMQSPKYYLMMEDDVIACKNYLKIIYEKVNSKVDDHNWFLLSFSKLGAIGKLLRAGSIPGFAQFLNIYWNRKPLDWLQVEYVAEAYCSFEDSKEECKNIRDSWAPYFPPSLFQHMGTYSSLKGKIVYLKDSNFNNL